MTTFSTFGVGPNRNPVLDADTTLALPDVLVGATLPVGAVGTTVAALLATTSGAQDPDQNELGIAITGSTSDIHLYYSLDNGTTWLEATDLRDTSALLLAPSARIYALPNGGQAGDSLSEAFSFQLWDQTIGHNGDTGVDVELGPRLLPGSDDVSAPYAIASNGQVAYLATEAGIRAFDLIDGGPVLTQLQDPLALDLEEPVSQLLMSSANGTPYLYARTESGILAFDVSDPLSPVAVNDIAGVMVADSPQDMAIAGNWLYTTTTSGALHVFDISGAHPVNANYFGASGNNIEKIALSTSEIAFATNGGMLSVYASNIPSMLWMGSLSGVNDIAIANNKIYASSDAGLYVADFQGGQILPPPALESVNARGRAIKQLEIVNGKLYAATDDDKVFVYDLQDMDGDLTYVFPQEIDISSGHAESLVPVGDRLYIANPSEGFQIVDLIGHTAFSEEEGYASLEITEFVNTAPVLDDSASPSLPSVEAGGDAPTGAVGVLVSTLLSNSVTDADGDAVGMVVTDVNGGTLYYSTSNGFMWNVVPDNVSAVQGIALSANTRIYFRPSADSTDTISDALTFRAWDGTDGNTGSRLNVSEIPTTLNQTELLHQVGVVANQDRIIGIKESGIEVLNTNLGWTSTMSGARLMDILMGVATEDNAYFLQINPYQTTLYASITQVSLTGSPNIVGTPLTLGGQFPTNTAFSDIAVHGDTLLIASTTHGVFQVALDSEGTPSLGNFISMQPATAIALNDTRIVIGNDDEGLRIINRADNSERLLNFSLVPGLDSADAFDIFLHGDRAYVAANVGGLLVADISNPAAPTWLAHVDLPSKASKVIVVEDRVFVETRDDIQVIDVSDMSNPAVGTPIALSEVTGLTQVGDKLAISAGTALHLVSTGILPDSVSSNYDTVSVDVVDTTAPTLTLPATSDAHLRGQFLTIASDEAGIVYLVKAGAHTGTPTAAELLALVQNEAAIGSAVNFGNATFDTESLLGDYMAYGVDAAGNVSSGLDIVTIRTVPALTITEDHVPFTEGSDAVAVAPDLVLADADAVDTGLDTAHVMLLPKSSIIVGGAPVLDVSAQESLVLVANPATMGSLTGSYSADEGILTITGEGTLAQWQAALRAVQYSNTSKNPIDSRSVKIIVVDTDGEAIDQQTVVVDITPVDDKPTITGVPAQAQAVTVGNAEAWAAIKVVDPDSTTLTVTLTATHGTIGGITPVNGAYVLQGTASQINTTLEQLTFTLAGANTGSVSISVSDGVNREPVVATYTFQDITAPAMTLPSSSDAHLRGQSLTIGSDEAGAIYLVKAGTFPETPTAAQLNSLILQGDAQSQPVINGNAVFNTTHLLGEYDVYAVDAAWNVSSGTNNTVTIRTVPELDGLEETLPFVEGGDPITVAPDLVITDADAVDAGLAQAVVMLLPTQPILVGGAPVIDVSAAESLILIADPTTMGSLTGSYSGDDNALVITGNGTLAQWEAALRAVQYSNTSQNPVDSRSVRIIVVDTDGETTDHGTVVVDITPFDDQPTLTGVPAQAQTVTVGAAAGWAAIKVADPDSTTLTVTLTASNGAIGGVEPVEGAYVLHGTAAQINETLAMLTFTLLQAGTGSVSISVTDGTDRDPVVATYSFASPVVTPPVMPPVTPTTPFDGVPVQISTGTDGQQQIVVPVVMPDRNEDTSTPNGRLADIAVVKNAAGVSLLNLGLPVGTGLTTNGPATTVTGTNAQTVFDGRITAASGTAEQKASAQAFLNSLPSDTQVVVQTVTVTAQTTTGSALVVSATNLGDGHRTAVVIDTRSLPAGTLIDLENIDFAVIVGDARVTGGAGANIAYGDDDAQFIVLGEGDDILHGGGGNDTVGSLRGNDQVFGDAGDDMVYGGSGNDTLHGGTGNDAMNGGFGFDTGVQSGARGDYTVRTENGSVILTHRTSGEVDRFTDVERITFDSSKAIVIAHEAADVATLRAQYANDDLIELNLTRAIIGAEGNDVITPELGVGRNIDLGTGVDVVKLAGGRDDVHLDVEAGQIVDLTRLEDGAMLSLKNVELLEFANGDVTVLAQNNDQAILGRAYELLLGRNVDVDGFQFWAEALNAGVSLQSVLQSIVTSQEAADVYKLANGNFIEQLYVQGLDRESDAAGKTYWADALASGVSRAVVLEGFAGSAEAVEVIGSTVDVNVVS